jgi:hypothetical protein
MKIIKLEGTDDTPKVILDPENDHFEISGRSLPEDASVFYEPILEWLKSYANEPNKKTLFNIKLGYFNTASSKLLLDILMILEEINENDNEVLVNWYYPEDDEDMEEAGEEYAEIVDVPFDHLSY